MIPLWFKLLASDLYYQDVIEDVHLSPAAVITARYLTGFAERYALRPISSKHLIVDQRDAFLGYQIPIYRTSPTLGRSEHITHYIIERRNLYLRPILQQRLTLHRFVTLHLDELNLPDYIDPMQISEDWDVVLRAETKNHLVLDTSWSTPHARKWSRILEYYFGLGDTELNVGAFHAATEHYLARPRYDITTSHVRRLAARYRGFRRRNPSAYMELFRRLKAKSVIDLHPKGGQKALACALLEIKYIAPRTASIDRAIKTGLQLDYEELDDQTADVVIADNGMRKGDFDEFSLYRNRARFGVYFVVASESRQVQLDNPPKGIVKVNRMGTRGVDYLFVYKSVRN